MNLVKLTDNIVFLSGLLMKELSGYDKVVEMAKSRLTCMICRVIINCQGLKVPINGQGLSWYDKVV